jgi:ubiquinone/menaquinone biosynthesis C-methylase UbiE
LSLQLTLMRAYWACERRLTPGLRYSQAHYEDALNEVVSRGASWLDIGCGHRVLPPWRLEAEKELVARAGRVIGADPDMASLLRHQTIRMRVLASLNSLPFAAESFDLVTANMVVEHLDQPEKQFAEVARVLRPGGRFVFHTPNAQAYATRVARLIPEGAKGILARVLEGRRTEDVFPTFYRANTAQHLHHIAANSEFSVREIRYLTSSAVFAVVLPLAIVELLWIRLLMTRRLAPYRHTLIGIFEKQPATARKNHLPAGAPPP